MGREAGGSVLLWSMTRSRSAPSLSTRVLRRFGLSAAPSPIYRGLVLGVVGGLIGTLAMGQYWTKIAPQVQPDEGGDEQAEPDQNVISPLGQQHEDGERATAALGRSAYELVAHQTPGKETRAVMSEAVHWAMGLGSGAIYGALSARHGAGLLSGGVFGAALWLMADESLVPLLGLQDGPASTPPRGHLNRLGAHLSYGAALGLGVWALGRLAPE